MAEQSGKLNNGVEETNMEKETNDIEFAEKSISSLDDIENAPDDIEELFVEPPTLELDDEPSEDDLRFEEMNVESI